MFVPKSMSLSNKIDQIVSAFQVSISLIQACGSLSANDTNRIIYSIIVWLTVIYNCYQPVVHLQYASQFDSPHE